MKAIYFARVSAMFFTMVGATALFATETSEDKKAGKAEVIGINYDDFDETVRPQDNFYQYANGTWLKSVKVDEQNREEGKFSKVSEAASRHVYDIISDIMATPENRRSAEEKMIVDLFSSFLNEKAINDQGLSALQPILDEIQALKNKKQLMNFVARKQKEGFEYFYSFVVQPHKTDTSRHIPHLYPAKINLTMLEYDLDTQSIKSEEKKNYRRYIKQVLTVGKQKSTSKAAKTILKIEQKLYDAYFVAIQKNYMAILDRTPYQMDTFMSPANIHQLGKYGQWPNLASTLNLGKEETLLIHNEEYFTQLDRLIGKTSLTGLKNYLTFVTLDMLAAYVSSDIQQHYDNLFNKTDNREYGEDDLKHFAAMFFANHMSQNISQIFAKKHFDQERKRLVTDMVSELKNTAIMTISQLTWASPQGKKRVIEKLSNLTLKIGYPEEWQKVENLSFSRTKLVSNILALLRYQAEKNLSLLKTPHKKIWQQPTYYIGAHYDSAKHQIVLPAGFLQPPIFDPKKNKVVLYATLGSVIGHEIIHALINTNYDMRYMEAYHGMYDPKTFTKRDVGFLKRSYIKLSSLYNKLRLGSSGYIRGQATLNENIADILGLKLAYEAFEKSSHTKDTDWAKTFFIAFAQVWQNKMNSDDELDQLHNGVHSPAQFRVNGTLMNMPAFYEAYGIKKWDGLYLAPEKRVNIW